MTAALISAPGLLYGVYPEGSSNDESPAVELEAADGLQKSTDTVNENSKDASPSAEQTQPEPAAEKALEASGIPNAETALPEGAQPVEENPVTIFDETADIAAPVPADPVRDKKTAAIIARAREAFNVLEIEKASQLIKKARSINPVDREALALLDRITKIENATQARITSIAGDLYQQAIACHARGNTPETMLLLKKTLSIMPSHKEANALIIELNEKLFEDAQMINNKNERAVFERGIQLMFTEKFGEAAVKFRSLGSLSLAVPYRETCMNHEIELQNRVRAQKYIDNAMKDIQNDRFDDARGKVRLALTLEPAQLKAITLMERLSAVNQ